MAMMKKFLILVYCIFIWHSLLAQDSTNMQVTKESKWALNFLFSPDYNYRISHKIAEPPINSSGVGYKTSDQIPKIGWHASTLLSYKCAKHFFIQTGLILENKGYYTKRFLYYISYDKYGQINYYDYRTYKMNYYLIGIPLLMNGEFELSKRLYATFALGINYYNISRSVIKHIGVVSTYEREAFSFSNYLSGNGSIGLNYYTKQNVILSLKPTFTGFLTSHRDSALGDDAWYHKLYLYSYGVEFGIGFGFGKKK
ncbi:MAG: hypothetical protein A3F72_12125 [Bacteroidetes bacterium RIFCSPLOWO2_12_FULL_35_15]|nr:MAG: hypothetical protein A3F72_12125 [Bacteroidetes bacterium RIFCSPLOWO2_12_FULL_35_15]